MNSISNLSFSILFFTFFCGCAEKPDFGVVPTLSFKSISKSSLRQGEIAQDSIFIALDFTDGDGDISSTNNFLNLTVIDRRTNEIYDQYKVPQIPAQGANQGVKGQMIIKLFSTCCITQNPFPCEKDPATPTNDLSLDIFLLDAAGNQSNTVTTPIIKLICF